MLTKGDVRTFVLSGLDPPRRVAGLSLPSASTKKSSPAKKGVAKKAGTKKAVAKKAAAVKAGTKKVGAKKAGTKKVAATKAATKATPKKMAVARTAAKKSTAKKATAKGSHQEGGGPDQGLSTASYPRAMEMPEPIDVLPHRPPFLFVTAVDGGRPGRIGRGRWELTGAEPFFAGHFPGRPTLPGVLMIESLAQLGRHRAPARSPLRRQAAALRRHRAGPVPAPGRAR